jgi:hypothetical protein
MAEKIDWLNRLAKWRMVFASWQLGTRSIEDPECQAVRDHREATLLLRAEVTAITDLLIRKGVFTAQELADQTHEEARLLCGMLQNQFPGFKASDIGIEMDVKRAAETTKNWRP